MRIGVPAEIRHGETRVAATPETVRKLTRGGHHQLMVQAGAGTRASISDAEYEAAGASIVRQAEEVYSQAEILLKVCEPETSELSMLRKGVLLVGLLNPYHAERLSALAATGVTAFALEKLPRITRAQTMDVLSSQANIAGYKAVILAANEYKRFFPMLMTAAGTVTR